VQKKAILKHMRTSWISPIEALNRFGCFRLAPRILEIKEDGYNVVDRWKESPNGARFKEYKLGRPNKST